MKKLNEYKYELLFLLMSITLLNFIKNNSNIIFLVSIVILLLGTIINSIIYKKYIQSLDTIRYLEKKWKATESVKLAIQKERDRLLGMCKAANLIQKKSINKNKS